MLRKVGLVTFDVVVMFVVSGRVCFLVGLLQVFECSPMFVVVPLLLRRCQSPPVFNG